MSQRPKEDTFRWGGFIGGFLEKGKKATVTQKLTLSSSIKGEYTFY